MVTKYVQSNGLRVILEPVESAVSISAGLWLTCGSRDESQSQYGYAHFVEHMLFKGTQKYSAQEMARMVDRVGGQHNAATNREYTCYYVNVMADQLELAVDLLSEMYYNPLFDSAELEKEKNVIIEEILMYEDTPDEYVHDLFAEYMLQDHPLSHSILGTNGTVEAASSASLREFYNDNYRNENAIFVIAGNFNVEKTSELINRCFNKDNGRLKAAQNIVVSKPRRVSFKHTQRDIEQMHFCLGAEGLQRNAEDRWVLYALSTILGGSMSSRLFQKVREEAALCYSIYSFHSSFSDLGIFGIYCATGNSNFQKAVDLIVNECRALVANGITAEELQDAKTFMKGNLALSLESIEVRMGQLAKNEINFGRHFTYDDVLHQIERINVNDFMRVTRRLFEGRELSLISVGKQSDDFQKTINLRV